MNVRRLVAAFLLALMCSGLFTWVLSKRLAKPAVVAAAAPVQRIVVAAKDLKVGEAIDSTHLTTMSWPASQPLAGSFKTSQEVSGRILLLPVSSGEPVLAHDLAAPGERAGLMSSIPEGMRAISVRADEVADVSGFVLPGSSVDVLVSYHVDTAPGFASSTVLEDVHVLAVGEKTEADVDSKPIPTGTVTLLVTPEDAVRLTQASSLGKIVLVLRNGADQKRPSAASEADFGYTEPPGRRAASGAASPGQTMQQKSEAEFTVETISGGKQTSKTFEGAAQ